MRRFPILRLALVAVIGPQWAPPLAAEELVSRKETIRLRNMILDPAWTFTKTYFFQRGFEDGLEGLTIAYMAALYTFLNYAKARNMSGVT